MTRRLLLIAETLLAALFFAVATVSFNIIAIMVQP